MVVMFVNSNDRESRKLKSDAKRFMKISCLLIMAVHILYFLYFAVRDVQSMAMYNAIVVMVYLLCLFLINRYLFVYAVGIGIIEISVQTVFTSIMLGNRWGFYFFNFVSVVPAAMRSNKEEMFMPQKLSNIMAVMSVDIVSFYIAYYLSRKFTPIYTLTEIERICVYLLNATFTFIALIMMGYKAFKNAYRVTQSTLRTNAALNSLAATDPLTGLWNRRSMDLRLREKNSKNNIDTSPFSLLMLDIDFFKRINDSYGHNIGDNVLVNIAECIKNQLRYGDVASRWGGDEFLILLNNTSITDARSAAERIRAAVENCVTEIDDKMKTKIKCTVTIGVTTTFPADMNIETVISLADKRLYHGKQKGRNRVESE